MVAVNLILNLQFSWMILNSEFFISGDAKKEVPFKSSNSKRNLVCTHVKFRGVKFRDLLL